jgi:hypothetical protein
MVGLASARRPGWTSPRRPAGNDRNETAGHLDDGECPALILSDMDPVFVVSAWFLALMAGGALFEGITEVWTGRVIINPRRISWSVGEARVSGLVNVTRGLFGATGALFLGLVGVALFDSAFWFIWFVGVLFLAPISQGLIEQHHNRRWPFKPPVSQEPPVEPA